MAIFHFPQFEHEPFWQYLSRLNDYRVQYVLFMYEKWKICDVVLEGITHETRATLESMCYGGLCSLNASYQLHCECVSEAFVYPSPPPPDACSYCQSFDHDVNSCPSYVVFNDLCARLNVLLETIRSNKTTLLVR